ncbi:MAG TPA: nitrogenase component 1 [Desulfopila sp.]|nr:nitrogenase component 1 [Desulfopila sp.]
MSANYTSTTNACKLCRPLGASLAFRGIEGCVPFLHGSQGCATYMRRYIISHFNEPIDIASSALGEKQAVYGGAANLKLGLVNVTSKYAPQLIGVATTCLTETIGDDVAHILKEYRAEFATENSPTIIEVSTPSYAGTHMEGFHGAVKAAVEQLSEVAPANDSINLLCGFISAADIRYLREVFEEMGIDCTLLPDYSDTLDGPALDDYPLIPRGGTPISAIRSMSGARATIELGSTLPRDTAGTFLQQRHKTPLLRTDLPIGIRLTDTFFQRVKTATGLDLPARHTAARGRLVDAMVDGHKYIFGKRAVIYGEEDMVVGLASFLAEIGIQPVLCASGGKSGAFKQAVTSVVAGMTENAPIVMEDVDFYDIEERVKSLEVDLLIGHSKGYSFARQHNIPLIRVGFPIHDRVGGQRLLHLGYQGAQQLFDTITNSVIAHKQDTSPVGYSYM